MRQGSPLTRLRVYAPGQCFSTVVLVHLHKNYHRDLKWEIINVEDFQDPNGNF
jgi:hypothetical protein